MSDKSSSSRRARSRQEARFTVAAALVLLAMLCAWAAGYAARTPLKPAEPLAALVDFDAAFIARCSNVAAFWDTARALPRYQAFSSTAEGEAFLASSFLARVAGEIDERSRLLGYSTLSVFDLFGGDTIVVGPPPRGRRDALLLAGRVAPGANLMLGLHAWLKTPRRLPTPAGDWWMMGERGAGVVWTKVGDVLAVSNDVGMLTRFVAASRTHRREISELKGLLSASGPPQLAIRLPAPRQPGQARDRHDEKPKACVLTLRLGPQDQSAAPPADGPDHVAFRRLVCDGVPADTCAGQVSKLGPVATWRLALSALPEPERDSLVRSVEDDVCAILDVDDFEDDVLGRLTGDLALVVSHRPDPWMTLASGQPMPTISLVCRVRTDQHFADRLEYALREAAAALNQSDQRFAAEVLEREYRGRHFKLIRVNGHAREPAAAGYFVVPDESSPGHSLIIASTSTAWLQRAIDTREGRAPSLRSQAWFADALRSVPANQAIFSFVHGDLLAGAMARARGGAPDQASDAEQWLNLLGVVSLDGSIGKDGIARMNLRITGEHSREREAPATSTRP